jgi:hypothetical protein
MCSYVSGVEFGTYRDGAFSWKDKHKQEDLLELHIFDEVKELRAVLSGDEYIASVASESDESGYEAHLDEYMRFFGEEYETENCCVTRLKDKGNSKDFYIKISERQFKDFITLGVRNYIKYDENDMIQVANYRLLGLFSGKTDKERKIISYA